MLLISRLLTAKSSQIKHWCFKSFRILLKKVGQTRRCYSQIFGLFSTDFLQIRHCCLYCFWLHNKKASHVQIAARNFCGFLLENIVISSNVVLEILCFLIQNLIKFNIIVYIVLCFLLTIIVRLVVCKIF